jgi:hypothetical protein
MNPIFREKLAATRGRRPSERQFLVVGLVLIIASLVGGVAFFDLWRLL